MYYERLKRLSEQGRSALHALRHRAENDRSLRGAYRGDGQLLARLQNGSRIYLASNDLTVTPFVALAEPYEADVQQVLRRVAAASNARNFFDVGANVGYHALMLSHLIDRSPAAFHLFEPNPAVAALLRRSIAANGLWDAFRLNESALSFESGKAPLNLYGDLVGGSSILPDARVSESGHPWTGTEGRNDTVEVATDTLDSYTDRHGISEIDLMKIDVEGFEPEVIAGGRGVLGRSRSATIVLEFTFAAYESPSDFWALLSSRFTSRYVIGSGGSTSPVDTFDDLKCAAVHELINVVLTSNPAVAGAL